MTIPLKTIPLNDGSAKVGLDFVSTLSKTIPLEHVTRAGQKFIIF
jgi:hypothetical protein